MCTWCPISLCHSWTSFPSHAQESSAPLPANLSDSTATEKLLADSWSTRTRRSTRFHCSSSQSSTIGDSFPLSVWLVKDDDAKGTAPKEWHLAEWQYRGTNLEFFKRTWFSRYAPLNLNEYNALVLGSGFVSDQTSCFGHLKETHNSKKVIQDNQAQIHLYISIANLSNVS